MHKPSKHEHVYRVEHGECRARYTITKVTETQIICGKRMRLQLKTVHETPHGTAYTRHGYGTQSLYVLATATLDNEWRIREARVWLHDNVHRLTDAEALACMELCRGFRVKNS